MDGKGKNPLGITNENSIGIEICVNSDGNYEVAFQKAIELTKYLMEKYNIPAEHVQTHNFCSGKLCPASMRANNWAKWHEFKNKLITKTDEDYTEYIQNIYKKLLRRDVDPEGLKYWNDKLQQGMTKGEFLYQLTESKEFKELSI